ARFAPSWRSTVPATGPASRLRSLVQMHFVRGTTELRAELGEPKAELPSRPSATGMYLPRVSKGALPSANSPIATVLWYNQTPNQPATMRQTPLLEDIRVTAKPVNLHPAFEWLRSHNLESLNITVEEYRHRNTGAAHYHLAADFDENVFLVALRTVPMDSTGVAHILEHTALCGSERFPVRDPFFLMLRRSLNTFMNAFTSSDWTAYPFASQNRKDFDNLLEVYLDALCFSRHDPLDFAQEGHRLEFANPKDPNSELVYKGAVFNEMKGAMSSVSSALWDTLCKYLYPSTTYHYNSGGDPEHIPDLRYEDLKNFYQHH